LGALQVQALLQLKNRDIGASGSTSFAVSGKGEVFSWGAGGVQLGQVRLPLPFEVGCLPTRS
jgi:hypothetical protein